MISSLKCSTRLVVHLALVGCTLGLAVGTGEPLKEKTPERLALSVESVDRAPIHPLSMGVKWDGREYDVESGIDVLMSVVRDAEQNADTRHYALLKLVMLRRDLEGHPCLNELARLYEGPGPVDKDGIVLCFAASLDPRGIPVFIRTLDREKNMKLRLSAAAGLAQWNLRRGVAELVDLLESDETLPKPARMLYVRDNALDLFRTKNRLKGWGFPKNEWWKSIDGRADLDEDQRRALYSAEIEKEIKEIKKWFAENEHRFPDWKPGDPVPEVSADEKQAPADTKE